MITFSYSIFDNKAKIYSSPFYAINDQVALRNFTAEVNQPESMLHKFPNDYCLYCIGKFDDLTGWSQALEPIQNLGMASSMPNSIGE